MRRTTACPREAVLACLSIDHRHPPPFASGMIAAPARRTPTAEANGRVRAVLFLALPAAVAVVLQSMPFRYRRRRSVRGSSSF